MAYRVRILPTAEKELDAIVGSLVSFEPSAARRFTEKYRKQLELLSSGTVDYGLSRMSELARLGYHACLVNAYVMLYYYDGTDVVIAHIFHGSQDYARLAISDDLDAE